ncbi:MAG TPA: hypothetical protein VK178_01280 [Opitutaceae bacterium]|nr:hypothetical protein [Opitutaceae bacterium]
MRRQRQTLRYALFATLAVALLAAALLTSPVQTLIARAFLAEDPDLQYYLDSLSARFGHVELADLRLRKNKIVLKVPSVRAQLPVYAAARRHQLHLESFIAKGWTLDLANRADLLALPFAAKPSAGANTAPLPEAVVLRSAADLVTALFARRELPYEFSIAALELEGDVILPTGPDAEPIRLHVRISGGDIRSGSVGRMAFEATTEVDDARALIESARIRGQFAVALDTARSLRVQGLEFDAALICRNVGPDRTFNLRGAATPSPTGPSLALALDRGARQLASLKLRPSSDGTLRGDWTADLRSTDMPARSRPREIPDLSAAGAGTFAIASDLAQLRVAGSVHTEAGSCQLPSFGPAQLGQFAADAQFTGTRSHSGLRVEQLAIALAGPGASLSARALQPFALTAGADRFAVAPADPDADWLELSITSLALERLPPLPAELALRSSTVAGKLAFRTTAAGYECRTTVPLVARGVTVTRAGTEFLRGVDLSTGVAARFASGAWSVQYAPISVTRADVPLASGTLSLQPAGLTASWRADLTALLPRPLTLAQEQLRTFTGKLTTSRGAATQLDGEFSLQSHTPAQALTATVHLESYAPGVLDFRAPIEINSGSGHSELVIEGGTRRQRDGAITRQFALGGRNVVLDHLKSAGASALALRDLLEPAGDTTNRALWAGSDARVQLHFEQLHSGETLLKGARGTLVFVGDTVRLEDGVAQLPSGQPGKLSGSVVFTPGAALPYNLAAVASVDVVNAARFFPAPSTDSEPLVEGCFALTDAISGSAADLSELPHRLRGRLQLTGGTGVVRLLKTNIGGATLEKSKPVSDAVVTGTSAVASLFGVKGDSIDSGQKSVGKAAAATRSFNYELSAITYERGTIGAVHEPDGSIRIESIELSAPDLRLTGSGELAAAPDANSFVQQPLRASLRLGARGRLGEYLAASGLGDTNSDVDGFRLVSAPIELGGTLAQVDTSRWREVLVAALKRSK